MGRADDIRARYEAELALIEAEDALIEAKAKGVNGAKLRAIKGEVRTLRQAWRERRDAEAADVIAYPAPASAKATARKAG